MNFPNIKFIKIPHLSFLESLREVGRNPFVDWIVILVISMTIGIISITCSVILYKKVVKGDFQGKDIVDNSVVKIFDKGDLAHIVNLFDKKNTIYSQVKKGSQFSPSPSL